MDDVNGRGVTARRELDEFTATLGRLLREARERTGYTRVLVAELAGEGVSAQTLYTWETAIRPISVPTFIRVCDTLGVSANYLFGQAWKATRFAAASPGSH